MEEVSTSETSVSFFQAAWCNILEDSHLHTALWEPKISWIKSNPFYVLSGTFYSLHREPYKIDKCKMHSLTCLLLKQVVQTVPFRIYRINWWKSCPTVRLERHKSPKSVGGNHAKTEIEYKSTAVPLHQFIVRLKIRKMPFCEHNLVKIYEGKSTVVFCCAL
jgi:hypothetical protein